MGVQGLLGLLRSIQKPTTLKNFSGQTVGIDAFGWLHRGTVACAIELALGKPTTKYVDFAVNRVRMLLDFGITPYLVFDGDAVPSKSGTNDERRKRREEAKILGLSMWKSGNKTEAYRELQKAASVTPQMTRQLIEALKIMNVAYVVAPYEADAQLVYLENKGIVDCILSEDSDLLVFGAKRLITKLDQYGDCIEIERKDFPLCKEVSFAGWTDAMFRAMAILSGCDYLSNINKMGLKTAHEYVRKYKDPQKAIRMMSLNGKYLVPVDYSNGYKNAELTFLHHRVFCPIKQEMVFLNDLERGMSEEDMPFLGPYVEAAVAVDVARGHLNPKTKEILELPTANGSKRALQDGKRQAVTSIPELKPSKSIDSFFKSNRRPLAELDPNSLTPSPSQQQVMQRNRNAQWEPHLVRSAPQLRPSSTRVYIDSHPASSSKERNSFLARAGAVSQYKPTKRQRLCSDVNDVSPSKEIKHSPFFKAELRNTSPLLQKTSRQRRAKRTEFDVWSDDSVEQIMLGFEGVCQANDQKSIDNNQIQRQSALCEDGKGNVASIENENQSPTEGQQAKIKESQSSHGTEALYNLLLDSDDAATGAQPIHVNVEDHPEEFEDLLEYHVKKQNECVRENNLARTFANKSPHEQIAALEKLESPKPHSNHDKQSSTSKRESKSVEPRSSLALLTEKNEKLSMIQTFVLQSPERQSFALKSLELSRPCTGKVPSQSVRRETTVEPRTSKVCDTKGSEDNMVANSEDEVSEAEDEGSRPSFDLKSFAYIK